jgi:hypothetical protein
MPIELNQSSAVSYVISLSPCEIRIEEWNGIVLLLHDDAVSNLWCYYFYLYLFNRVHNFNTVG